MENNIKKGPFVICKAAAGSGKTFNLVKEYLKLAMAGGPGNVHKRFRGILAITFTNKAANEMKTRIMKDLGTMIRHGVDPKKSKMGCKLLPALNEERAARHLPALTDSDLRSMATDLRSAILHRYSDLSVCTIDSFMHRVVRTFARDLEQPVNFEVMIEQDDLIEHAVSGLMSLVGTEGNESLTEMVNHFAVSNMENGKGFDIVWSLTELAKQLFSEEADTYLKRLDGYSLAQYKQMHSEYQKYCADYECQVESLGAKAMELLHSIGMGVDNCNRGKTGFYSFFQRMEHFRDSVRDNKSLVINSYVEAVFESADYNGDLLCKSKTTFPGTETIAQPLRAIYFKLKELLDGPMVDYNTCRLLLGRLYPMALLGELNRQMRSYAEDNEVVHLSDFNRLINKVVREEPMPFVYERLGARYHHFLIDEFQDTSVLQWQNLVPLLEGGVAEGQESLVVGDGKQAIYRFRQGDVRQFVDLPQVKGMGEHGKTLSMPGNYRMEPLEVNYRTADDVVTFNNDFFSWLVRHYYANVDLARKIYLGPNGDCDEGGEELRQKLDEGRADRPKGHVGISFVDPKDPEAICARVLEIINHLIDDCGYQARDIMILGRTKRELATVGSYLLEHSGLEQNSAESFYLRKSQAVMAIVAALRYLYDNADRVAAADLLYRLNTLGVTGSCHDEAFLTDAPVDLQETLAGDGIDFNTGELLSMDLYGCLESLVKRLRLDDKDLAYTSSLLNRAAAFSSRHQQGIGDFLEWFDSHADLSASSVDGGNAVRLMTIHKAKGLQARVVICAFFPGGQKNREVWVDAAKGFAPCEKPLPAAYVSLSQSTSTRFDAERDLERESSAVDNLNILYVAFTRPEEQLYVVCPEPDKDSREKTYAGMLKDYLGDRTDIGDKDFRRVGRESGDDEEEQPEEVYVHQIDCGDWEKRANIASKSEKAMTPLLEERVRFGIHAHALLASIMHADDNVASHIEAFVKSEKIEEEESAKLAALVHEVLSHPDTSRFFNPSYKVKNECDLTDGDEPLRPDRVVFAPDETWVVDFKTGADAGALYDEQVSKYCRAIASMGYPKVSGWLLFLLPQVSVRQVALVDSPQAQKVLGIK